MFHDMGLKVGLALDSTGDPSPMIVLRLSAASTVSMLSKHSMLMLLNRCTMAKAESHVQRGLYGTVTWRNYRGPRLAPDHGWYAALQHTNTCRV